MFDSRHSLPRTFAGFTDHFRRFAHCIAGSGEILGGVLRGQVAGSTYLWWLAIVTAGNILGGVLIVTVLNFGQAHAD